MKKILILLVVLMLAVPAYGANHYIRDGGSGDGSTWTAALDDLPNNFIRGDTYYVADGAYGSHTFDTAASGALYVYIKKAISSDHGTETGWVSTYGDGSATFTPSFSFETDYWSIDGQTRTGWATGYTMILDTPTSCSSKAIRFSNAPAHVTLKYLQIEGFGPDGNCGVGANDIVYSNTASTYISFQYCWLHDAGRTHILSRGGGNWLLEHTFMDKCESDSAEHSESWSMGRTSDTIVRYNWFNETEGTGVLVTLDNYPGPDNWKIYGNIFTDCAGGNGRTVGTDSESVWTNILFYNNTIVGGSGYPHGVNPDYGNVGTGSAIAYNNIFYDCGGVAFGSDTTHDYNAFDSDNGIESETHGSTIATSVFTDYVADKTGDFTLVSATSPGVSLATDYNSDIDGNTRGYDGVWDRGAFEFMSGLTPPVPETDPIMDITYPAGTTFDNGTDNDILMTGSLTAGTHTIESVTWANTEASTAGTADIGGNAVSWSDTIDLVKGDNTITATATDSEATTTSDSVVITYSPTVTIATPTTSATYDTHTTPISVEGTSATGCTVSSVIWANAEASSSGTFTGTTAFAGTIDLVTGDNTITATMTDSDADTTTDVITVTYQAAPADTGDPPALQGGCHFQ